MKQQQPFTILSIDGGGIRGLIPAKVLADLELELQKKNPSTRLHDHFDLICGTSTGALLAIGISLGIPASKMVEFYWDNAELIFPKRFFKILPRLTRALFCPIYNNGKLREKLAEVYSNANGGTPPILADLKTKVCIPVFNGNEGKISVLKTGHHSEYFRDFKLPAHDVALSSASAPVYFQPHSFTYSNAHGSGTNVNMIDGGVFANNPALIGLLEATEKLNHPFSNIRILSLGTGQGKHTIKKSWLPKNIFYWMLPKPRLLDIILDSQAQMTEQYIAFLHRTIGKTDNGFGYLRVQYDMGGDFIDLNASSPKDIERLDAIGDDLSKRNISNILKFIK